jgi:hypothetical protein
MSLIKTGTGQKIDQIENSTSAIGGSLCESTVDPTNLAYIMANRKTVIYEYSRIKEKKAQNSNQHLETQQILEDPIIMNALRRSDSQFIEGKAKPLCKLIADLGFKKDELLY